MKIAQARTNADIGQARENRIARPLEVVLNDLSMGLSVSRCAMPSTDFNDPTTVRAVYG